MNSAGHTPCNHVKTPAFMMQNYHLAQTTHNTNDTDKVHGRLYGRCFLKYSSAFQVTVTLSHCFWLRIINTTNSGIPHPFKGYESVSFEYTLVDSIQVLHFHDGMFSGQNKARPEFWIYAKDY